MSALKHRVAAGRWQRVFDGAYVTHNGPVSWRERAAAAVLARGPGSVVSLDCALHLWGLSERQPPIITLAEASDLHRQKVLPGVKTKRRRRLARALRHDIPVTSLAQTILDVVAQPGTSIDEVMALITRAVSQKRIEVPKLRAELLHHPRHPWARILDEVLEGAAEGLGSAAEMRYARDVEAAHGLPKMVRQVPLDPEALADGRSRSIDFRDEERGIGLEIDGSIHHAHKQLQDRRRDRRAAGEGDVNLRAGWVEVVATTCELAADVAVVQWSRGWEDVPFPCSPGCGLINDARVRQRL